ncbi:Uncharacterized protein dnm_016040 [Desulfonema magnum]|uniref:Uncharacterized protein n=1 Tax=Desulfonema magnum TaxID=45655 RepID=A0A975BHU4_9BACT|nr:Uncharacterized protein dnm_016040 [Desulfonema magnum]
MRSLQLPLPSLSFRPHPSQEYISSCISIGKLLIFDDQIF